jgi:23S rRNA pseudouridine2605 synthase
VLARTGLGSRRGLERCIEQGRVTVDGQPAHLGTKVTAASRVTLDGHLVSLRGESARTRLLAYHKPVGQVCTRHDPQGRPTVFDTLPPAPGRSWVAVGRLDVNTAGLVLFTDDGDLAARLMHPRSGVEREYAVRVLGPVTPQTLHRLLDGVALEDGHGRFETIQNLGGRGANHWYRVMLREGRQREVRRLWESQNVTVSRLLRVRYGSVVLPADLRPGHWRELSAAEVAGLKRSLGP